MSATVLTLLYAVADTSGIPPGVPSELAIESTPTDLVGGQAAADPDLWLYRKRNLGTPRCYTAGFRSK